MLFALLQGLSDAQMGELVPIVALVMCLCIGVAIVIAVAHVKSRKIEAERDMLARRLAYDQRLKELEIERLRITGSAAETATRAAGGGQ